MEKASDVGSRPVYCTSSDLILAIIIQLMIQNIIESISTEELA